MMMKIRIPNGDAARGIMALVREGYTVHCLPGQVYYVDDDRELRKSYEGDEQERIIRKGSLKDFPGDKRTRELKVALRFVEYRNAISNTDYKVVDVEYRDVDAEAVSASNPDDKLLLQITMADDEPWHNLAKTSSFQRRVQNLEQKHHSLLKQAIQKKMGRQQENLILLLEGLTYFEQEELKSFKDKESQFLKSSGFREIWYIGDCFAPMRLFP